MLRRLQTLTLLASGVVVAACGDRDSTPTSPQFQVGTGPTCSPTLVKRYARDVAGSTSPLYNIAQQFTTQNANKAGGTTLFFQLAAEAARLANPDGLIDPQQTALGNLLVQGIACADVTVSDPSYTGFRPEDVTNFANAAGHAGGLEVRGRSSTENDAIYTHNPNETGSSGVQAPSEGFDDWYGGAVLFYGFPINGFSHETSASSTGRVAFEWFTVRPRSSALSSTLRGQVAICVLSLIDPGSVTSKEARIQHVSTVLPVGNFTIPCTAVSSMLEQKPITSLDGALAWLRRQLLPEPLQATSMLVGTTPSGSAKSLSPIEAINPNAVTLTYDPGPVDGQFNKPLGVKVHATAGGGTDWEGLLIKIQAQDNNGNFVAVNPDTITTNALGIADFTSSIINKAGVYQLLAFTVSTDPDLSTGGFDSDSVLSGNFLQRPKK
jgi:hypothetical protein